LKPKWFLAMVKPLIVDVVIGTAHQSSEGVKNPLPYNAIAHAEKSIEVEADLETLKGVLEGCITVDVLKTFLVSRKSLGIKIIQQGLSVVFLSDIVYFTHN
jgi:hypothetical protein